MNTLINFYIQIAVAIAVCSGVPHGRRISMDDIYMQVDPHTWLNNQQSDDIMGNGPDDLVTGCGGKPADIYFAIDTSDGTSTKVLKQQFYYASELLRAFYLKENTMRIGAISYGSEVRLQFRLGVYSDSNDIKASIRKIHKIGGSRNTDLALEFFVRRGFSQPESRQNVGQILIMFTTGSPSNIQRSLQQADSLKRQGVYIYVISLGNDVTYNAMTNIASTPSEDFVFNTVDYAISDALVSLLRIQVCNDQPAGRSQISKACIANRPVDIIFAVDEVSIGARNSRLIFHLIEKMVHDMDNTTGYINVGLLNSRNINFTQFGKGFENIETFLTKLEGIRIPDNGEMLRKARRMVYRGRPDIQKTLVIFYDENVDITKKTLQEAKRNKFNNKMEIYVIAVGKYVDMHAMSLISSKPSGSHLVRVFDYQFLHSKHRKILDLVCTGW